MIDNNVELFYKFPEGACSKFRVNNYSIEAKFAVNQSRALPQSRSY